MQYKTTAVIGLIVLSLFAAHIDDAQAFQGRGRGFRGRGRGPDAQFPADREVFHFLLSNHKKIQRKVKLRKDGVETVTESSDPKIAKQIQVHVRAMYQRVEKGKPIRRRDPLFNELFRHAKKITMKVENTKTGVRVVETSKDPHVVKLIQAHAKVVSKFVKYGFDEAHKVHPVEGAGK